MQEKKPKQEYTIICDDIREEVGNKVTFVGTYGPYIFVSKIPFTFPKLCFVNFCRDIKLGDSISMELISPSRVRLGEKIDIPFSKHGLGHEKKAAVFAIFSPLAIQEEGSYKLKITFNNDTKNRKEFKFNIKLADSPQ